jgi:hypothetical protein
MLLQYHDVNDADNSPIAYFKRFQNWCLKVPPPPRLNGTRLCLQGHLLLLAVRQQLTHTILGSASWLAGPHLSPPPPALPLCRAFCMMCTTTSGARR